MTHESVSGAIDPTSEPGTIELRIRRLEQLFNTFDPSPFHERDLDDDAEDYIVSWARELPRDHPIRLVVHLPPEEALKAEDRGLPVALAHYFDYRAERLMLDMKELFRLGRRYLVVGIPVLALCLGTSHFIPHLLGEGAMARTLQESLIIIGWVANWKPLETFLYDWWPIARRKSLYERLAAAEIILQSDA